MMGRVISMFDIGVMCAIALFIAPMAAAQQNDNLPVGHPAVVPGATLPQQEGSLSSSLSNAAQQSLMDAWADTFADKVDVSALGSIAVQIDGRVKSFDSHAAQTMQFITGPRRIDDQSRVFSYLDLIFRAQRYEDEPIIYVKKKQVRATIIDALRLDSTLAQSANLEHRLDAFLETGLIAPALLERDSIRSLRARLAQDLIRTAAPAADIDTALALRDSRMLFDRWNIIPPSQGDEQSRWLSPLELVSMQPGSASGQLSPDHQARVSSAIQQLGTAWINSDADGVNVAAAQLAALLPTINRDIYPSTGRLSWESWYFRAPWYFGGPNMTGIWVLYALALVPMLLSVVFRWNGARWAGMGLFLIAFGFHTFALLLRWYVAQRWPNTNMFEAVITSAWFGGVLALVMEPIVRRTGMRGLFMLGSSAASMVALMCAYYMPIALNPNISNKMPVLHDVWLYIHTNVIIFSYCLIFMAAISALLYLARRFFFLWTENPPPPEFAKVGGAGSLIMTGPGAVQLTQQRATFGQVLDGTTMILMELSFILLWTGLVMGAIWADHSWGRPWGWDPKEVFALNTFIIFAILIHTRLKTKDKGLWTAVLAVIGAGVMLFNWIFINFYIVGLHSYA